MKQTFLILMLASSLVGCGRISITDKLPTTPVVDRLQAAPTTLVQADLEGRADAKVAANAPLVFAMLGVFNADGSRADTVDSSVILRYVTAGLALRTVFLDFRDQAYIFDGAVKWQSGEFIEVSFPQAKLTSDAEAAPLVLNALPTPAQAVALALKAGLPGTRFVVQYQSHASGPMLTIGEWRDETDSLLSHVVAARVFDALTGQLMPSIDPTTDPDNAAPDASDLPDAEPTP